MLSVGVERDDDLRPAGERERDAALERRALPPVDGMAEHDRAGAPRDVRGCVLRAVVDDDDLGDLRREGSWITGPIAPASL